MTRRVLETGTTDLLAEAEDGIAVLTMNRPERRNALSDEMLEALGVALATYEADPQVRCIVLTGAGGAFCAGGDVKVFAESASAEQPVEAPLHERIENQRRQQRITAGRLHAMAKPTIACLDGAAAGAGLGLALACDLRIASGKAALVTAFARVGLSSDYGVSWFLTRMLGESRALELMWTSDRIPAERAAELGLVNRVVEDGTALAAGRELARRLADGPAVAQHAIKTSVLRAGQLDLLSAMDLEVDDAMRCAATEDHLGAVAALAQRATPVFHGR